MRKNKNACAFCVSSSNLDKNAISCAILIPMRQEMVLGN